MKFLIVFVFAVAACMAFEICPQMKEHAVSCGKETNVDLTVFKPGQKPDMKIFENRDYKCFAKCIILKADFVNEKGDPNYEVLKKTFDAPEEVLANIRVCADDNKQSDICERVFGMYECAMKKIGA